MVAKSTLIVALLAAATSFASAQTCVEQLRQCGGKSYTGVKTCCSGSCKFVSDWYSQCVATSPSPSPSPKTSPSPSPSPKTSPSPSPSPVGPGRLKYMGINIAGAEFGNNIIPGTLGKEYMWPTQATIQFFVNAKMDTIRLPFLWERLQPTLNGNFDSAYQSGLTQAINMITGLGANVMLEPHNFGRYPAVSSNLIGNQVSNAAFNDFWVKVANLYKSNSKVWFNLMNEPHDQDSQKWAASAQGALNAIRAAGATNKIIVPGVRWTGAWSWLNSGGADGISNADALAKFTDPLNNFYIEVHQYLDDDYSGTHNTCTTATAGRDRLVNFTNWARANKMKGFLGEMGGSDNAQCISAFKSALEYMEANRDVWEGFAYWAAGDWWPQTDVNEIQPRAACGNQPCKTGIWNALKAHL